MERNKWETAIRCLEIALHPHTSDDEVIAAVNGFRRTANGAPLGEICGALADAPGSRAEIERLSHENHDFRQRATDAERRLDEAAQRATEREIEHAAAERRAAAAERELADFRAAYGRILDRVNQDNTALRQALERRDSDDGGRQHQTAAPFRKFLAAAQGRSDRPAAVSLSQAAPDATRGTAATTASPRRPWMA